MGPSSELVAIAVARTLGPMLGSVLSEPLPRQLHRRLERLEAASTTPPLDIPLGTRIIPPTRLACASHSSGKAPGLLPYEPWGAHQHHTGPVGRIVAREFVEEIR